MQLQTNGAAPHGPKLKLKSDEFDFWIIIISKLRAYVAVGLGFHAMCFTFSDPESSPPACRSAAESCCMHAYAMACVNAAEVSAAELVDRQSK